MDFGKNVKILAVNGVSDYLCKVDSYGRTNGDSAWGFFSNSSFTGNTNVDIVYIEI